MSAPRILVEHLKARRAGFDSFAAAQAGMADALRMICPSQLMSGHHIEETGIWAPPSESVASRPISPKSKGSCRGSIVDTEANRILKTESQLERHLATMLMARRDIVSLVDQPPAVIYRALDGIDHEHTFDFLAQTAKGTRIAFAVKPEKRRESSGVDTIVALIERQVGARFADRYMVVSERDLTPTRVYNAKLILLCRKRRNDEDIAHVREFVATVQDTVKFADLVARTGIGARGFNALVCLIDDGALRLTKPGQRIGYLAEVLRVTEH